MLFGKHVNKFYIKYGLFFLIGIAALIVVDYVQLIIPKITGDIISGLKNETLTSVILKDFMIQLIYIAIIIVVGRFLWRIFIFGTSRRIDFELRNMMFSHAEKLSQQYYQTKKSGGLMALFTNDLNAVRMAFGPGIMMTFDVLALGSLGFYKMYMLSPQITYFAGIPLILIAILATYISKITGKKFKAKQKAFEDMSDFTQENFYGISVIKAFVNETRELKAFAKINKDNQDKNVSFIKASTLMGVSIEMFITLIRILMIGVGGYLVYKAMIVSGDKPFDVGDLTAYIGYFGALIWPMMAIGRLINMRSQANASLQRISAFLDQPIEIHDDALPISVEDIEGKITFNHLTFAYPGSKKPELEDINFVIETGETIGIIGRTGSGKTTLVDLLLRLYNLKTNEILIDDYDIMKLPIKQLRDAIGYVPQDNFIFSDIIRNNISFALDEADSDMIERMAKYSDVHENIIDFPDQYDTMVGERGVTLSGGQKQRISIARALLKNPKILIMDDSFSAVDTKTEEEILHNIFNLREGKTTIIIAHRISTIRKSDKIVFIENGKVKAIGNHEYLMSTSKEYAEMVLRQQLESELEGAISHA
ncbi:MAG: ABC transporter ATP-binding protein [Candidatus Izemoplasmatales bacterium]|jgi:ATP-binding cassette subfamily B protein|nr:ABC transporter ATP-binding protein [Candidatus Izemoplasmatales bacterium]